MGAFCSGFILFTFVYMLIVTDNHELYAQVLTKVRIKKARILTKVIKVELTGGAHCAPGPFRYFVR